MSAQCGFLPEKCSYDYSETDLPSMNVSNPILQWSKLVDLIQSYMYSPPVHPTYLQSYFSHFPPPPFLPSQQPWQVV